MSEKAWIVTGTITAQVNMPSVNKHGGDEWLWAQIHPPFIWPQCLLPTCWQINSPTDIIIDARHPGGQLVLEKSMRTRIFYLYLSSFWGTPLQIAVQWPGLKSLSGTKENESKQSVPPSKLWKNRMRPRMVRLISAAACIWQIEVSICVP